MLIDATEVANPPGIKVLLEYILKVFLDLTKVKGEEHVPGFEIAELQDKVGLGLDRT